MLRSPKALNKKGFLLLEVLVSVTIISFGLIFVARSFSTSARAVETAARFLKSVSLIEEKLWDLEAKGAVEKGRADGTFERDGAYKWDMDVEGLDDIPLDVVKIRVEWEGARQRQRVSLETYMWNEED